MSCYCEPGHILNRGDCCGDRLNGAEIRVGKWYILNRGDCCGDRLDGAEIRVGKWYILNRGDCCEDRLDGAEIRVGKWYILNRGDCNVETDWMGLRLEWVSGTYSTEETVVETD